MTDTKPRRGGVRARRTPRSPQMTITVPQAIIDAAERNDSRNCMIADTIKATLPYSTNVVVDAATIRWTHPDKGLRYSFLTPDKIREVIIAFDEGEHVEEFSFNLRHAHITPMYRRDGAKKRIGTEDWQRMKEKIEKIRSERGLKRSQAAAEIGISYDTLKGRLNDDDIPIAANVDKIEKWVLKHTGEKPAPRVTSQADQVAGPAQFRSEKSARSKTPEIIGGRPSPAITHWRQFGLRMFRQRPNDRRHG